MFPTLGLLASVRCPELSTGASSCKRSPCLFSHTAPAPRQFALATKRPLSASTSQDGLSGSDGAARPSKTRKSAASGSLFAASSDVLEDQLPTPKASTSTVQIGALRSTGSRKPTIELSRSGQVVRKQVTAAPARLVSSSSATSHATSQFSGSAKGKERAVGALPSASGLGPPRLPLNTKNSYFPLATRNTMLKSLYTEYMNVYSGLSPRANAPKLAAEHALLQETTLYAKNNKFSYRNACIAAVARLKKRPPIRRLEDACILEEWDARSAAQESEARNRLSVQKVAQLAMTTEDMLAYDYVVEIPAGFGESIPTEEGGSRTCDRCATQYIVHGNLSEVEGRACQHHWGRLAATKTGERTRLWSCCQAPLGTEGCTSGPHIFLEKNAIDLHTRSAFTQTSNLASPDATVPLDIVAIDCEMVYTTAGMSLARVTIIDDTGRIVLDEYVRPNGMIVDLVTRWSGITPKDIENKARMSFAELKRKKLGKYINEGTFIIGHGLENDLKALRLVHPPGRVVDTAQLFPHAKGLPYRNSLKNLARDHLEQFIQESGVEGHSSAVDARAALDLVKLKASKLSV